MSEDIHGLPADFYWPTERDPEKLASYVWTKTRQFFDRHRSSYHWETILRNWLYYHNLYFAADSGWSWGAVRQIHGGDVLAATVNEFRSIIDMIYTLITQQRPSFKARATTSDQDAIIQARWGDDITEHYLREQGLEVALKRAMKHALVLRQGYLFTPWDPFAGDQKFIPDEEEPVDGKGRPRGVYEYQGDFAFYNPTVFDVVYDVGVRDWKRNNWVAVRTYENKWDLVEQVDDSDAKEEIRNLTFSSSANEDQLFHYGILGQYGADENVSDVVPVWHFYHRDTPACQGGVEFRFVGEGIPLEDPRELSYERLPIFRCVPGETLMTQLGYSPADDLQAPQELLNAELSTIATNHMGLGFAYIWADDDSDFDESRTGEGVVVVRGGQRPAQGIDLVSDNPSRYELMKFLRVLMESGSGMNSVARGQPDKNLESGEALKVMDAKAQQSTSEGQWSYAMMLEETGTFILRTLRDRIGDDEQRVIALVGQRGRPHLGHFKKEYLKSIDCVRVEVGNPMAQTITGKATIAKMLVEMNMVKTPEELLTVFESGRLEPLLESDQAQLDLIHDENESMRNGEVMGVDMLMDNHVLHIREHMPLVSSVDARRNREIGSSAWAHCGEHVKALLRIYQDPILFRLQTALGYQLPPIHPALDLPGTVGAQPQGGGGEEEGPQRRLPGGAQRPTEGPQPQMEPAPEAAGVM